MLNICWSVAAAVVVRETISLAVAVVVAVLSPVRALSARRLTPSRLARLVLVARLTGRLRTAQRQHS